MFLRPLACAVALAHAKGSSGRWCHQCWTAGGLANSLRVTMDASGSDASRLVASRLDARACFWLRVSGCVFLVVCFRLCVSSCVFLVMCTLVACIWIVRVCVRVVCFWLHVCVCFVFRFCVFSVCVLGILASWEQFATEE